MEVKPANPPKPRAKSSKRPSKSTNTGRKNDLQRYSTNALSLHTADYAACLANPFTGPLARIPDYPPLNTRTARVFARGTFATSTAPAAAGFGYIVVMPLFMAYTGANPVVVNSTASTVTNINVTAGATSATYYQSNAEYPTTMWARDQVTARIVSCAVRIRNCSSKLTRGGQIIGLHDPNHNTLVGKNSAGLLAYQEAAFFDAAENKWTTLHYRAVDTDDVDFVPNNTVVTAPDQYYMGFIVQAADTSGSNPQTFEYEVYAVVEYQGYAVTGRSVSPVDPSGHGAVTAVAAKSASLARPHQLDVAIMAESLVHASSEYVKQVQSAPYKEPPAQVERHTEKGTDWAKYLDYAIDAGAFMWANLM